MAAFDPGDDPQQEPTRTTQKPRRLIPGTITHILDLTAPLALGGADRNPPSAPETSFVARLITRERKKSASRVTTAPPGESPSPDRLQGRFPACCRHSWRVNSLLLGRLACPEGEERRNEADSLSGRSNAPTPSARAPGARSAQREPTRHNCHRCEVSDARTASVGTRHRDFTSTDRDHRSYR